MYLFLQKLKQCFDVNTFPKCVINSNDLENILKCEHEMTVTE